MIMTRTGIPMAIMIMMTGDPRPGCARPLPGQLRLLSWLSPGFPVGSFAYSHGLETASALGIVHDAATLGDWLGGMIVFGAPRSDAVLLGCSHDAVLSDDDGMLAEIAAIAAALFGAPELALESTGQGAAFWRTVEAAWPHPAFAAKRLVMPEERVAYPVAVGVATAIHGVARSWLFSVSCTGFRRTGFRLRSASA